MSIDTNEDRAKAQARAITQQPLDADRVHVSLVHGFEDNPEGATVTEVAAVRRASEILETAGFDVTLEETSGDPAEEFLAFTERIEADLLVIAGRKRTPAGKVLFGSLPQAVILGTDRPVLVCSGPKTRS